MNPSRLPSLAVRHFSRLVSPGQVPFVRRPGFAFASSSRFTSNASPDSTYDVPTPHDTLQAGKQPPEAASKQKKPRKSRAKKVKVVGPRVTVEEAPSVLPADWVEELDELGAATQRSSDDAARNAQIKEEERLKAKQATPTLNTKVEAKVLLRRGLAEVAAQRIVDGCLSTEAAEFADLVKSINSWKPRIIEKLGLSDTDFTHDISTLRRDLIVHARRDLHEYESDLSAGLVREPSAFVTLLRSDAHVWEKLVEDPGRLSEEESLESALALLAKQEEAAKLKRVF